MPTKPKKPAAPAQPIQPDPPQLTVRQKQHAKNESEFAGLQEFVRVLDSITVTQLSYLKTFKLILERDRGCTTPIEEFLAHLILLYGLHDEDGTGLTVEQIESELQDLKNNDVEDAIETAHFLASRYPRPEPEAERA